jgi:hypothetical protein
VDTLPASISRVPTASTAPPPLRIRHPAIYDRRK